MTKKDLQRLCIWTNENTGSISVFSELFLENIKVDFEFHKWKTEGYEISTELKEKLAEFSSETSEKIRELIFHAIARKWKLEKLNDFFRMMHPLLENFKHPFISPIIKDDAPITEDMLIDFNTLISNSDKNIDKIKLILFSHCKISCEDTTYGDLDIDVDWENDETEFQENMNYFGVKTKEDAFRKSVLSSIIIDINGAKINFNAPWDEHGCEIEIKNGILI